MTCDNCAYHDAPNAGLVVFEGEGGFHRGYTNLIVGPIGTIVIIEFDKIALYKMVQVGGSDEEEGCEGEMCLHLPISPC